MRSFECSRWSTSVVSLVTSPFSTRKRLIFPANGSAIVLKTNAAVDAPSTSNGAPRFAGDGTPSTRRSSSACVPRFFVATEHADREDLAARDAELQRGGDVVRIELLALEVALHQRLVDLHHLVEQLLAVLLRELRHRVGDRDRLATPSARPGSCRRTCGARRRCPASSCSAPIGMWTATHFEENCSWIWPSVRKKSARSRSSMLTTSTRARPSSSASFLTRAVPTSKPITPETTTSAPSTTRSAQRASPWKDGSPGQSTRLIFRPCHSVCASESEIESCALLLVLVRVGDRRARLDRPESVDLARLEEERLDEGRLSRPAVADDGDVADLPRLGCSHVRALLLSVCAAAMLDRAAAFGYGEPSSAPRLRHASRGQERLDILRTRLG